MHIKQSSVSVNNLALSLPNINKLLQLEPCNFLRPKLAGMQKMLKENSPIQNSHTGSGYQLLSS